MDNSDEAAFLAFVDAQGQGLRGLAYVLTSNKHDADDLYQETLIKVFRSWSRLRDSGALLHHARTVMTRHYISNRWQRRYWERRTVLPDPPDQPFTARGIDDLDDVSQILTALAKLSRQQRAVIGLRFYCDLTEAQIAEELGCSPDTVKTHTARALSRLRNDATLTTPFGSANG